MAGKRNDEGATALRGRGKQALDPPPRLSAPSPSAQLTFTAAFRQSRGSRPERMAFLREDRCSCLQTFSYFMY